MPWHVYQRLQEKGEVRYGWTQKVVDPCMQGVKGTVSLSQSLNEVLPFSSLQGVNEIIWKQ